MAAAQLTITIPEDLLPAADRACRDELRTKSGLIAVALRDYLKARGYLDEQPVGAASEPDPKRAA
jgi:metal-responsive CopG/Arc/MetJ family transcriptional regulator